MSDSLLGEKVKKTNVGVSRMVIAKNPEILTTSVGSCVAIVVYNKKTCIGGLVHVLLSNSQGRNDCPGKYADTAVPEVLKLLKAEIESPYAVFEAKIAGGANMFGFDPNGPNGRIGDKNVEGVIEALKKAEVNIIAEDIGGKSGRTVHFYLETGKVEILVGGKITKIL